MKMKIGKYVNIIMDGLKACSQTDDKMIFIIDGKILIEVYNEKNGYRD